MSSSRQPFWLKTGVHGLPSWFCSWNRCSDNPHYRTPLLGLTQLAQSGIKIVLAMFDRRFRRRVPHPKDARLEKRAAG
jgi:hypothetical protein